MLPWPPMLPPALCALPYIVVPPTSPSLLEKALPTGSKLSPGLLPWGDLLRAWGLAAPPSPCTGCWGSASPAALTSPLSYCRRLELNGIKSIPPGAFSPYKKLRRM